MAATLKDISAELGLSVATVSRALNGFPEVNEKTRVRVRAVADRLGYQPNRVAQRLVTGRSGMVGMIARLNADMTADQTFMEILAGLTAALGARDVDLVLNVDQHSDPVVPLRKLYERGILDGFILNAPLIDDPRVAYLQSKGIPFVMHGKHSATADYPYYAIDNARVSADAVDYLVARGHRRIAFLNGEAHHAFAAERRQGFDAAMARAGLKVPDWAIRNAPPSVDYGFDAATALLTARDGAPPTAIVCASTLIAVGVLRAAQLLGIEVPQDLSVVAHDDGLPQVVSDELETPLTVTRSPLREACVPLAEHMVALLEGAEPAGLQTVARADFIKGKTTAEVPNGGEETWL